MLNRRQFGSRTIVALAGASLVGCGSSESVQIESPLRLGTDHGNDEPLFRILAGITFGPRQDELELAGSIGYESWLRMQLDPDSIEENPVLIAKLQGLKTIEMDSVDARDEDSPLDEPTVVDTFIRKTIGLKAPKETETVFGPTQPELQTAEVLRAIYSRRQVFETMANFWNDHFSIDQTKGDCRWLTTILDRTIRTHALGKFRDLLTAVATSPAMLFFLDNTENRAVAADSKVAVNENYARELLELHTLGADRDYTLTDIQGVARCFTGWSMRGEFEVWQGEFRFDPDAHDAGEKRVLGHTIRAGGGESDGHEVLEILCAHPATARFIATKLCRRFVSDEPSAALIDRTARAFRNSDGDLKYVLQELLTSEDYRDRPKQKLKRPFDYVASVLRQTYADTDGASVLPYLDEMGHRPYHWPLPDGYPDRCDRWEHGLLARWKFALDACSGKIHGTTIPADALRNATGEQDPNNVARALCIALTGEASTDEVATEYAAVLQDVVGDEQQTRQSLALIVASSDFQWR